MFHNDRTTHRLREQVDEILDRWRAGDRPDALAVLNEVPQLKEHHSLAVDLAYEEFCLREESGEALNPQEFCHKFGGLRRAVARMLSLHRVLHSTSLGLKPPQTVAWPAVGEHWLDWQLTEEIGRGAFSRVFLAEEPALGHRKVVVKCSTSGPDEAFVLGKLDHPQVMPIHSIRHDESRGLVGICMPYGGRVTLAHIIDELGCCDSVADSKIKVWPARDAIAGENDYTLEVAKLIEKVARGLHAAHSAEVLHGDIKPSNIILSFTGEPRLVDFNLADDVGRGQQRLGGTPPYMAPERLPLLVPGGPRSTSPKSAASQKTPPADFRSDVFSLGVVFFELLYGQTPFEFDVDDLHITYDSETLTNWKSLCNLDARKVPSDISSIVERAIEIDPARRFGSAAEFADALAEYIERHSTAKHRKTLLGSMYWLLIVVLVIMPPIAYLSSGFWYRSNSNAAPSSGSSSSKPDDELPSIPTVHSEAHIALETAIQEIAQGRYEDAGPRLRQIAKQYPSPEIYAWLGYCLIGVESYEAARVNLLQAEPDSDASGSTWHNIGLCETRTRRTSIADRSFDKALELSPYQKKSYEQRAIAKMRTAMTERRPPPDDMLDDIESALSLDRGEVHTIMEAARVYACAAKHDPTYIPRAEYFIRKGLEAGIAREGFAGLGDFDLQKLMPLITPTPAPKRKTIELFLPPPYDLQAVLQKIP